jgi:hypothetical protein
MRAAKHWLTAAWVVGLAGIAAQAQTGNYNDEYGYEEEPQQAPVFFFNDRIIDLAIDRVTEGMVKHYGLDEDQLWETREVFKDRFPSWIRENRAEIIDLTNQYIEAVMDNEPPSPEKVAEWAQRVKPLMDEFQVIFVDTTDELREFMTDEQQLILDGEMAVFDVAMGHMNQRLDVWRGGGYDWETEWPQSKKFKETQRAREEQLETEAIQAKMEVLGEDPALYGAETPPDEAVLVEDQRPAAVAEVQEQSSRSGAKPAPKKDEWTLYVEEFIRRYKLNEDQQSQAQRVLSRVQERRDRYLRRKAGEIDALYERYNATEDQGERKQLRSAYEALNAPLDRYFQQLKEQLDRIPTRRQRAAAAQADLKARTEPAPAKPAPATKR